MISNRIISVMTPGSGSTQGLIAISDTASGFHVYVFSTVEQAHAALNNHSWVTGKTLQEAAGMIAHGEYQATPLPVVHIHGREGQFLGMVLSLCDPAAAMAETNPNEQPDGLRLYLIPDPSMTFGLVGIKEPNELHFYIFYSRAHIQEIVLTHSLILTPDSQGALKLSAQGFPRATSVEPLIHLTDSAAATLLLVVQWMAKSWVEFEAASQDPNALS